ncbi:MAG: dicarboxylate/amino acid:cation symporter [Eubacteriaceae bacterium]|jgi:Na+/H+-dicarboxylate symporter
MKKKEKAPTSIIKKMVIALVGGIIVGSLCLYLKTTLTANGNEAAWEWINQLLFQDITTKEGLHAVGLFYIVGKIFMNGLQLGIVPLVLVSLSLSMCSLTGPQKLGKIAGKTILCFLGFYVVGATVSGCIAWAVKEAGFFNVNLPYIAVDNVATMESYNPLTIVVNAVPSNVFAAFTSNNGILSVVVIAVILGLCMQKLPDKTKPVKELFLSLNDMIQLYLDFWINKISPVAIFCMISRTFAIYGIEYLKPVAAFIVTTTLTGLLLVFTLYPLGIFLTTRLNPWPFMKKILKVGVFAAAVNSSAATLPLNMETCQNELGCSDEVTSFVLPTGMTINMNGTTVMHMIAITFIATSAGINITPGNLILAAILSISVAMGTPAIPVAGTTMIYAILTGLGFTSDACMLGYALVLAMNYPAGMAVITMNVVGDAATDVIVSAQEGQLDKDVYYGRKKLTKETIQTEERILTEDTIQTEDIIQAEETMQTETDKNEEDKTE